MADETPQDDLATRLAKLEADLKAEREENAAHRETLKTLQADRQPGGAQRPAGAGLVRLTREDAEQLANDLGTTVEWVHQNYPIAERLFRHAAGPVLTGLNGLVEEHDEVYTRQLEPDYKETLKERADAIRKEHVARGNFIRRRQALALARAERMEDPKYQDEIADRRLKEREEAAKAREAEQTAAQTEGTTAPTQTAGPSPTKGGRPTLDPEKFDALPLEEKRKQLDQAGITF